MDDNGKIGDINYFIELAATVLLDAKMSDEDEITYKKTRLSIDVIQVLDDTCDYNRHSRRDIKTGMVLHGFHILLRYLNENDLMYSFSAYNDIHRFFKNEWNCDGEEIISDPSLAQRNITYNIEASIYQRRQYTFSMSAKKSVIMEKMFRALSLKQSDGYAVCFLLSLYNMDSKYRKSTLNSISYLRSVTISLFKELRADGRKRKQWILDCDLNVFDYSIRRSLYMYSTAENGKLLSDYRDKVINIIEGCNVVKHYMNALGSYQMETEIEQLTERFTSDFHSIDNAHASINDDDLWVATVDDMEKVVYVAEDISRRNVIFHGLTQKGEFVIQNLNDDVKANETIDIENDLIVASCDKDDVDDMSKKASNSFFGKCRRIFNIINGNE